MTWIETVEQSCRRGLQRPQLQAVAEAAARCGASPQRCLDWVRAINELPATQEPIVSLRRGLVARGELPEESHALEQYLLLLAGIDAIPRVPALPTCDDVQRRFGEVFEFFAEPDEPSISRFRCGGSDFASMCKVATLRRFPAGQFEWELSGLPRSALVRIQPRSIPPLLRLLVLELGGLHPFVFPHFAACGPRRIVLREGEVKRSFHRMAMAMQRQPTVRGLLAIAWFLGPEAVEVSPHLSWLLPIFTENGGFVTTMGPAELGARQLATKPELKLRYESGEFRPRQGLVVWPRREMLRWAARHSELALPTPADSFPAVLAPSRS